MKKYYLCFLCLVIFLSACSSNTKPTETSASAPSGAAETSASAPESDLQETTETASTEGTKETTELQTTSAEKEDGSSSEAESVLQAVPEWKAVVIDIGKLEPRMSPPESKEVFRTQNELFFTAWHAEGDTLHIRERDTGSGTMEPASFAALSENEFIITDSVARCFKLFRDGKCVKNYHMEPGIEPEEIEVDNSYFYYVDFNEVVRWNRVFKVSLDSGTETFIPFTDSRERTCHGIYWMEGQLVFSDGYLNFGGTNYYLDKARELFMPTSKGFRVTLEGDFVTTEAVTWVFDKDSMGYYTRIVPIYVDKENNLYVRIEDRDGDDRHYETLRKYSADGELLWFMCVTSPDQARRCPVGVKYCRDGRIYFMIIWEDETVIYQVQEEIW